jgi:tripartite-type tricarboxylate transporter receptor subunit TctC
MPYTEEASPMKRRAVLSCAVLALALACAGARADYPDRPIRVIVPFGAGGVTDSVARITARALEKSMGQPVVVENKPGAEGAIAANTVKNAPSDGYTLFFATSSTLSTPLVMKAAGFDPIADFAPISTVGRFPYAMFIHTDVPAHSVREFVAHARANPGKLNYGTLNVGEQLAAAEFLKATGVEMVRIPYKQSPVMELVAGRIQLYFGPVGNALAQSKEGRVRLLATLVPERTPLTPDVPTLGEAGGIGITSGYSYQMFLAPAKTPREVVERLSREINAAVANPQVRAELEKVSLMAEGMTPAQLSRQIADAQRTWAQFFREAGVEAQ